MKKVLTLAAAVLALLAGCCKSAPKVAPLKVEGTQLMADGKPAVMRGVSFYNKEAVKHLHEDWGVPIFRAAIGADDHAKSDNPGIHGGYMGEPEFALECLYNVVDGAIECGAYVIVDWHSHVLHLDEAKDFFTKVATRYADCPNVIYELYNEPVEDSWAELKAYAEELIGIITGISKVHPLILMGCPHWDQDIHLVPENPVTCYDNLMYTVHFYAATHKDYAPHAKPPATAPWIWNPGRPGRTGPCSAASACSPGASPTSPRPAPCSPRKHPPKAPGRMRW